MQELQWTPCANHTCPETSQANSSSDYNIILPVNQSICDISLLIRLFSTNQWACYIKTNFPLTMLFDMKVFAIYLSTFLLFQLVSFVVCTPGLQNCICMSSDLKFDDNDFAEAVISYRSGAVDATGFFSCTNTNQDDSYQLQIYSTNATCYDLDSPAYLMFCNEEYGSVTARIGLTQKTFVAKAFCNDGFLGINSFELSCTFCSCPGIYSSGCFSNQTYTKASSVSNLCLDYFSYKKTGKASSSSLLKPGETSFGNIEDSLK